MNSTKHKQTIGAIVLNLILTFFAFGQTPVAADIRPLSLDKPIEREIKAAEEHFYTVKLKPNQALRLQLEEGQDANYVFRLINADSGERMIDADLTQTFGREEITYIAASKENLKVLVKAPEKINGSAKYKLTATVTKRATKADKERIKAEELSREAVKLSKESANLPEEKRAENYKKVVELAEGALAIRKKQADNYWEGWTLIFLGYIYNFSLGDYDRAEGYYEQSLVINRELKNQRNEALILDQLGTVFMHLYQFEKAAQYSEQALQIFREIKNRSDEINILYSLGVLSHFQLRQPEKAKNYYEQQLAAAREVKDRNAEAMALRGLGQLHQFTEKDKALHYFHQAIAIFQEIKDYQREAEILSIFSDVFDPINETEKAREVLEQALAVYRKAKDREGEISILNRIGTLYLFFSNSNRAIQYYEQALEINRELNNKKGEITALNYIGQYYFQFNKFGKSLQHYEKSLSIAQEIKDKKLELETLISIGDLYLKLTNYEKARVYYEKVALLFLQEKDITAFKDNPVSLGGGFIYEKLAKVYQQLKQYEKAKEYYEKELNQQNKERQTSTIYYILIDLATLYNEQKKYEKAQEYIEKAIAYYKENSEFFEGRFHLFLIGKLYQDQKQYDKAREYFERALAISDNSKNISTEVHSTFQLGKLYLDQKLYEKAHGFFEQVLAKTRENNLGSQFSLENEKLSAMVDLYQGLNNHELAIFYGKQLINEYQNIRSEIKSLDRDTQLSFIKDKEPAYRKLADLLISEGRFAEAQTVLDLLKEEEFRNYTVRRSGENPDTIPYNRVESDVAAKVENLAKLERERTELLNQKQQSALSAEQQSRLDLLDKEIEAANRAFRLALDTLGKSEASVEAKVADIKSEQKLQRALALLEKETGSKTIALYTLLGAQSEDERNNSADQPKTKFGWIILVTPNLRKAYPIDVADLEQTVFRFREALQSDKYDPQPLARQIYQKLFRQTSVKQKTTLEQDLNTLFSGAKDKTLMWSLDGILRYIPMAAMHDGSGYLVEKYRNVSFTKESFLTLTEKDKTNWQALGLGVSDGGKNFSPLPGAEKELREIVHEPQTKSGVIDGKIKLNKDFTEEEAFRLWREGAYPVVHIASHYSFNPTDPTSSFLLTGGGEQMTFAEMQDKDNLFGAVDLLTLSACETAMTANGKEAEGFAYMAQNLGAKSVIASLWKVSDEGTTELMVRFYKLRAENPSMTKAEAFRQAQLSLLGAETKTTKPDSNEKRSDLIKLSKEKSDLPLFTKDEQKPFAHPHYWSSFVLIGNWR